MLTPLKKEKLGNMSIFLVSTNKQFIRKLTAYAVCCLLVFPAPYSFAQSTSNQPGTLAGHVIMVSGDVIARDLTGADRNLARRSEIYEGDTIFTAPASSAQVRMIDDARISLQEATEFAVIAYQYEQDVATDVSTLELIQGGFRTISGKIGSQNRASYETRISNFATIGIRGTDYEVVITPSGNVLTGVYDGGTTVSNDGGDIDLGIGADFDFAEVANQQTPPRGLLIQPNGLGNIVLNINDDVAGDEDSNDDNADDAATDVDTNIDSDQATDDSPTANSNSNANNNAANLAPPSAAVIAETPAADVVGNQLASE